ncbi:hypothetical protein Clacol_008620 [Clathrus columnatus]|uniref:Fungal lipase-type domain-containing protein n=1 Tax=Clathrus columnatus TaxID=1419009 RepID=A0AAV5AI83_9AGAM|nr:hypothetical protein Clacol_008620 [Clathrus columnatus]
MSDIADSDFNRLKRAIMKRHLEQLQKHDLSVPKNPRREGDSPPPNLYDLLVQWTNDSKAQIDKGIPPDEQTFLVGPYCGAFIPKGFLQGDNSFIGVAFKGTGLPGEDINDIFAVSPTSSPDWLWGSQVGEGFFYPIFSPFKQGASLSPFGGASFTSDAISAVASLSKSTITHVTGHSLGAAYATLTYAELSIKGVNNVNAIIGDLYAFGSPRVGLGDFAVPVRDAVHSGGICKGSSWRVVNNNDFVTTVPIIPLLLLSLLPYFLEPFIHIDAAYEIFPDKNPEQKPSEIGTCPLAEWSLTTDFSSHDPQEYYKSLVYTMTGKPPINDDAVPVQWEGLSVAREIPKGMSFQKQFERISDSSLGLTLTLGNDTPVAFVDLPISSQYTGEANLTAGTCNWRFNRTDKVIAAEKSLAIFAKDLAELFAA